MEEENVPWGTGLAVTFAPMASSLYAYVNGHIVPADRASVSVFDRGLVLGDGLFETLRAVDGSPQFLNRHWLRLTRSAKRLRIAVPMTQKALGDIIAQLTRRSRLSDAAVRITLTRGRYLGGLAIDPKITPSLIVTVMPVTGLDETLYQKGVRVAISGINKAAASGLDASIKSTNYLANIFAKAEADKKKCYEAILLGPKGEIAELTTASFFVVRDGVVLTPPIDLGILPGITREVLLGIMRKQKIAFRETALFPKDLVHVSEAFLTSSVRGVVPIVRVEKQKIGSGKPGEIFTRLRELYSAECDKQGK
jgi:branched-chain amino acid aminotransferase